jgi:thioredoxin-related protein
MRFLLLTLTYFTLATPSPKWGNHLESALKSIQTNEKKVLLYFSGSDWCKPCIQLKSTVFETVNFKEYANTHLELVNVDFKRDLSNVSKATISYNESLAERYNPKGYFPLVVIIDKDGKVIKQVDGYKGETSDYYITNYLK